MPIYEYRCQECGYLFEMMLFKTNEAAPTHCPACQSTTLCKVISPIVHEFTKWPLKRRRMPPEIRKHNQ